MTPPRFIRNFSLGSSHLRIGDFDLRPATARHSLLLQSESERHAASARAQAAAIDHFLIEPTLPYRQPNSEFLRRYSIQQIEGNVAPLLAEARAGENVDYFRLLQLHYGLLERGEPAQIPGLSRRAASIATEYLGFLNDRPNMTTEEKIHSLYIFSRMLHVYLAYVLRPPRPLDFPERESTVDLLFSTLDALDAEFQRYHGLITAANPSRIADYEGVSRIVALRRQLHRENPGDRRQAAIDLAEELTRHPPPATPPQEDWQSRSERATLDSPHAMERLQAFDRPSATEERSIALNAFALETLEVAAATLDQANEDPEALIMTRYRDLGLVLSFSILRHPEQTLEELLTRLQNPSNQADIVHEIEQASGNPAFRSALSEALFGRNAAALATTAREAALHVQQLRLGPGAEILSTLLQENQNQHPIRRIAEELSHTPSLAAALHLPLAGATDPIVQREQAIELLRRGSRGLAEIETFHASRPDIPLASLRESLSGGQEIDGFASSSLNRLAVLLNRGQDHEIAALNAVFSALDRSEEVAPGIRLSETTRGHARSLNQRLASFGFRSSRVLSHLFSGSSIAGIAFGILATEFLPTLLIARGAGVSGSLVLARVPIVTRGALTGWGAALNGVGTGLAMSLVGSSLHQWERHRQGLSTNWGRDFGTSLLLNSATFALSMPLSRLLNRALTPRFDATSALMPLSVGRRLLLHGSNVAMTGGISFGLGYLGRGVATHQWRTSPEEVAENFGSILLWEAGAAGLRAGRRSAFGYSAELGPYRRAEVQRLTGRILEMHSGLGERRGAIENHLAREEARYPGWLEQFGAILERGGHVPILEGQGRNQRLLLVPEASLPPPISQIVVEENPAMVMTMTPASEDPVQTNGQRQFASGLIRTPPSATISEPEAPALANPLAPVGQLPPLITPPTNYYLRVEPEVQRNGVPLPFNGDPLGFLNLRATSLGENIWIVGREHFPFLFPASSRAVRRSHFMIRRDAEGNFSIRDLPSPTSATMDVQHHGTFQALNNTLTSIPSNVDSPLPLHRGDPDETVRHFAIGNDAEPIVLSLHELTSLDPHGAGVTPVEPSFVSHELVLPAGGSQRIGNLLVTRAENGTTFHLAGEPHQQIQITRSSDNDTQVTEIVNGDENPLIGQLGGTTRLVVSDPRIRRSRVFELRLGGPLNVAPAALEYYGMNSTFAFNESGEIAFGRSHQPSIFIVRTISNDHFRVRRVVNSETQGVSYTIAVQARYGMQINGTHYNPGAEVPLSPGTCELGFYIPGIHPEESGPHPTGDPALGLVSVESSFRLTLP